MAGITTEGLAFVGKEELAKQQKQADFEKIYTVIHDLFAGMNQLEDLMSELSESVGERCDCGLGQVFCNKECE